MPATVGRHSEISLLLETVEVAERWPSGKDTEFFISICSELPTTGILGVGTQALVSLEVDDKFVKSLTFGSVMTKTLC